MKAPVSVAIRDLSGQWMTLQGLSGVTWTTEAPKGCTEGTIPLGDMTGLPDLQQGCRVRVCSGDTGKLLWSGRLSSPVRQVRGVLDSGAPSFEGQAGTLADQSVRYTPVVTRQDAWSLGSAMKPYVEGATVGSAPLPQNAHLDALTLTLPAGWVRAGDCALAAFHGFFDRQSAVGFCGQHTAMVWSGNTGKFQVFVWNGGPSTQLAYSGRPTSGGSVAVNLRLNPNAPDLALGYQYNGALVDTNAQDAQITGPQLWSGWWKTWVFGRLRSADGGDRTDVDPVAIQGVRPHWLVTDLIGTFNIRGIPVIPDPTVSVIDESSDIVITSYDFSDLATMADILTDLNSLVPTHFWYVHPTDETARGTRGAAPLTWEAWASTPTILLPPGAATYDTSASDTDLANAVQYSYTGSDGTVQYDTLVADYWTYPDAAIVSQAFGAPTVEAPPLNLTSLASPQAARQVAQAYLAEWARLPKSATATVSVPVVDSQSGARIPPWELRAGVRAHIPETGDTLPVTKCVVDVDTATATLTLGQPRRSVDQIVTTMSKRRARS